MERTASLINSAGTYTLSDVCTAKQFSNHVVSIQEITNYIECGQIVLHEDECRITEALNCKAISHLIWSMLNGFPIAKQIYAICNRDNDSYEIIHGQGYIRALIDFVNNKRRLENNLPSISCVFTNEFGDKTNGLYDVSGKKFKELPKCLQNVILSSIIEIGCLHSLKEDDYEDVNYWLNGYCNDFKPYQKVAMIIGSDRMKLLKPILDLDNLWANNKRGTKLPNIIRSLMLISGYGLNSFSIREVLQFTENIDDYSDKIPRLESLYKWLNDVFGIVSDSVDSYITKNLTMNIPFIIDNIDTYFKIGNIQLDKDTYANFLISAYNDDSNILFHRKSPYWANMYTDEINEYRDNLFKALHDFLKEY